MSLYQASFRLRHECPYRELSDQFPDLTIREWYLSDCQVLEITSPTAPADNLIEQIQDLGTILHQSIDDTGLHVVTQACLCSLENTIIQRFENHNCLYQPPTVHRRGWEEYQLIAFNETDIKTLYEELETDREIDIVSKTGLADSQLPHTMLTPVDQIFDALTDRQLAALQIALENGYYNQPRQCSISELADHTTVARATFEEHLRKAENKLITNAGQFVRLLSGSATETSLRKPSETRIASGA